MIKYSTLLLAGMVILSTGCNYESGNEEGNAADTVPVPEKYQDKTDIDPMRNDNLKVLGIGGELPAGLMEGTQAPEFKGVTDKGDTVSLKESLKSGPVVLMFYRGQWCPHCNRYVSRVQDSLELVEKKGAQVIAVVPDAPEDIDTLRKNTGADFLIISDIGYRVMNKYDVSFRVDEEYEEKIRGKFHVDLEEFDPEEGSVLPIPATYVINKEGVIVYRFFNPDYKKRPNISEILKALENLN